MSASPRTTEMATGKQTLMEDLKSQSIGHLRAALARAAEAKIAPDKAVPVITALEGVAKMSSTNEQEETRDWNLGS